MIRLTVLYNLQPFVDEDEFLEWRLGKHQESNMSQPGVLRSTFSRSEATYPNEGKPTYRFITTADWPDMETFNTSFYDPDYQKYLKESLKLLKDPLFLISEIVLDVENDPENVSVLSVGEQKT